MCLVLLVRFSPMLSRHSNLVNRPRNLRTTPLLGPWPSATEARLSRRVRCYPLGDTRYSILREWLLPPRSRQERATTLERAAGRRRPIIARSASLLNAARRNSLSDRNII